MTIHVERIGSGPEIILLHGWGLHSGLWGSFSKELAKNFSVRMVDLPGHGYSSELADGLTIESMAKSVNDALEKEIDDSATILGWSLGAFVALEMAAKFPNRFNRLVWVAGTPSFVQRPGWPAGMNPDTLNGFAHGLKEDYRATLKRFISLNSGKAGDRILLKNMQNKVFKRGEPSIDTLDQGLKILRDSDCRQQLASTSQPMLMVQGTNDRLVHPDTVAGIKKLRPVEAVLIEGAGHAPFLSEPTTMAKALQEFIQ